jgi:transposase
MRILRHIVLCTRLRGRCLRGERLIGYAPHGHWKTITFVAGLRQRAMVAPFVLEGAMNGPMFLAYVKQFIVPTLKRDEIVVIDKLPAHKVAGVKAAIEATGARLLYLPSYSPDLNPIEQAFSKVKAIYAVQRSALFGVFCIGSGAL